MMGWRYGAWWVRGLWVYLMLIVINVVVGVISAGVARLLRFAISEPFHVGIHSYIDHGRVAVIRLAV
jgi:phage-related holin